MKTEHMLEGNDSRQSDRVGAMFHGAIFAAEYMGADFGAHTSPSASDDGLGAQATKDKTCKPTRNPCCKVDVEGTKDKTCKPTRNPCCKSDEAQQLAEHRRNALDLLTV